MWPIHYKIAWLVCTITVPSQAKEAGSWFKSEKEWNHSSKSTLFAPAFGILKTGIFSHRGVVHWVIPGKSFNGCQTSRPVYLWITHRLGKTEILDEKAGEKLGNEIGNYPQKGCIAGIEIDLEPLTPENLPWLLPFLSKLKTALPTKLSLRLAFPPVSPSTIPGNSWNVEQAEKVLAVVDGFDLMIYDSGLKTNGPYLSLFQDNLKFVAKHPGKKFTMGLPAYPDRTLLHLRPEKLAVLVSDFENLSPEILCLKNLQWAFYAYWAMSVQEMWLASRMQKRLDEKCAP